MRPERRGGLLMSPPGSVRSATLAEGPPWFMAYVLFDGDSLRFAEFIHHRISVLDEAWGLAIHGTRIGNPKEMGRLYERLRAPRRARLDTEASRQYPRLLAKRGSEQHHIIRETEELARHLGVPRRSMPALMFRTNPPGPRHALLGVAPGWLVNPEAEDALSRALQSFLSEERIERLVKSGTGSTRELCSGLQRILDQIAVHMRAVTAGLPPPLSMQVPAEGIEDLAEEFTLLVLSRMSKTFYKGQELQLNFLPFHLNLLLAKAAQQGTGWVGRGAIEENLWRGATDKEPHTRRVDDAMRRLRAAYLGLKGVTAQEVSNLLLTKRKIGYRLSLPAGKIRVM